MSCQLALKEVVIRFSVTLINLACRLPRLENLITGDINPVYIRCPSVQESCQGDSNSLPTSRTHVSTVFVSTSERRAARVQVHQ